MLNVLIFVLTALCLFCRFVQYLGLVDHLDLGHIARSIWIIKLWRKEKKVGMRHRFQLYKKLCQLFSSSIFQHKHTWISFDFMHLHIKISLVQVLGEKKNYF